MRQRRSLSLHKETLRALSSGDLARVAAATGATCDASVCVCVYTYTCTVAPPVGPARGNNSGTRYC